jgi:hypothetical protein
MLLSLINLKQNLQDLSQFKTAIQAIDDVCDADDQKELRKLLTEEFCTRLFDQKVVDVTPAF